MVGHKRSRRNGARAIFAPSLPRTVLIERNIYGLPSIYKIGQENLAAILHSVHRHFPAFCSSPSHKRTFPARRNLIVKTRKRGTTKNKNTRQKETGPHVPHTFFRPGFGCMFRTWQGWRVKCECQQNDIFQKVPETIKNLWKANTASLAASEPKFSSRAGEKRQKGVETFWNLWKSELASLPSLRTKVSK